MKIIKLTEAQFKRLFEANRAGAPNLDGGDLKEYPGSEVSTTANVTNANGDLEYGEPQTADKFQKTQTMQNYWANGHLGGQGKI